MILPDTSVWVEYLRAGGAQALDEPAQELDRLMQHDEILVCGPVVAELLAGVRAQQRDALAERLAAQAWIELERADWLTIGRTAAELQQRGLRTPLLDVEIAVCAVKGDAELWTLDGDFKRIEAVLSELRLRVFDD